MALGLDVSAIKLKDTYLQKYGHIFKTLLQTLDLENFATAYRSSKRVVNLARERWTLQA